MKVKELRDLAKASKKEYISEAMVEIYKALTKSKKEDLDETIRLILSGEQEKAKQEAKKNKNKPISFDELSKQVSSFVALAKAGCYGGPNRIVSKKKRSTWRFEAKRYIKGLLAITPDDEHFSEANILLEELFKLLSTACGYYIFNTENPFGSVGITQTELFNQVVTRNFMEGFSREMLSSLYKMAAGCYLSWDCLHEWLMQCVTAHLDDEEMLRVGLEEIKKLLETSEKKAGKGNTYRQKDFLQKLAQEDLSIGAMLGQLDTELPYYFKHTTEKRDMEIALYCAMESTHGLDADDQMYVYEYAIKHYKIKPRDELKEKYQDLQAESKK